MSEYKFESKDVFAVSDWKTHLTGITSAMAVPTTGVDMSSYRQIEIAISGGSSDVCTVALYGSVDGTMYQISTEASHSGGNKTYIFDVDGYSVVAVRLTGVTGTFGVKVRGINRYTV